MYIVYADQEPEIILCIINVIYSLEQQSSAIPSAATDSEVILELILDIYL